MHSVQSGTDAINLTFRDETNAHCQSFISITVSLSQRNVQPVLQTPPAQGYVVKGDISVYAVQRGGVRGIKESHRGGGVPEERQNTGPGPQLVIW